MKQVCVDDQVIPLSHCIYAIQIQKLLWKDARIQRRSFVGHQKQRAPFHTPRRHEIQYVVENKDRRKESSVQELQSISNSHIHSQFVFSEWQVREYCDDWSHRDLLDSFPTEPRSIHQDVSFRHPYLDVFLAQQRRPRSCRWRHRRYQRENLAAEVVHQLQLLNKKLHQGMDKSRAGCNVETDPVWWAVCFFTIQATYRQSSSTRRDSVTQDTQRTQGITTQSRRWKPYYSCQRRNLS